MGSTFINHQPENIKEWLDNEFTASGSTNKFEIIASSIVAKVYYGAMKITNIESGESRITAIVALIYTPKDGTFGYKEMTECVNPYYYGCPKKILKLLTPTDNELSNKWRERCIAKIANKKRIAALKTGELVQFKEPIKFSNGTTFSEMVVVWEGKKLRFHPTDNPYMRCRISEVEYNIA